jgi:hypothetical protein
MAPLKRFLVSGEAGEEIVAHCIVEPLRPALCEGGRSDRRQY